MNQSLTRGCLRFLTPLNFQSNSFKIIITPQFRQLSQSKTTFNDKNGIDKEHLAQFQKQMREEVDVKKNKLEEEEEDKKSIHTKFYRTVGIAYLKTVIMTFATFYGLRLLWEYLDATDEETIATKQIELAKKHDLRSDKLEPSKK